MPHEPGVYDLSQHADRVRLARAMARVGRAAVALAVIERWHGGASAAERVRREIEAGEAVTHG